MQISKIQACILLINLIPLALSYSVSISYPFLVSNQSVIDYIQCDSQGNYFIQFANGTVVKYDPTFTSVSTINYPQKIEQMNMYYLRTDFIFQNGTAIISIARYQQVITNNRTSIYLHDSTTFAVLSSYNFNETIIKSYGSGLNNPFTNIVDPHQIVILKHSVKLIYQSQIYLVYNYDSIFGSNVIATTAVFNQYLYGSTGGVNGYISITYEFYITNSLNQTYDLKLIVTFVFNETTLNFDLSSFTSESKNLIFTTNQSIRNMQYNRVCNVIIMQSVSDNYYFYAIATNTFGMGSTNLTSFVMLQLFDYQNMLYILTTTGLIQIEIPLASLTVYLILLAVVNLLPLNSNYDIVLGYPNHLLYIIKGPNVYTAGDCLGQTQLYYYKGNYICASYSCLTQNCNYCPLNSQTCVTCNSGYIRNSSFLCMLDNSRNPPSQINQTNTTNSVNQTNTTNQISNLAQKNSFTLSFIDFSFLLKILNVFLAFLSTVISVPGARAVITPIFYLFGNFDNFFLYQYHDRTYNPVVNDFFNQINNLEAKKWDSVNTTQIISRIGKAEQFYNFTNFQQAYQQFNYSYNTVTAGQSEGLFYNSQNYLIGVLPIIFVQFLIIHLLFYLLYNYSISKIVRNYQFWFFLLLIQLDGNVQQLTFYLCREWLSIFTFSFEQKLFKILVISYGFMLIFVGCSAYYLFCWLYKAKIKVIMENNKYNLMGIFYMTVDFGLRNIYFGVLNFFGRFLNYEVLMEVLLFSEVALILLSIFLLSQVKLFKNVMKIWLAVILSLFRVLFILSLIFDYENNNILIEKCHFFLILLMIATFCFGLVLGFISFILEYAIFFNRNCCKDQQAKEQKKINLEKENIEQAVKSNNNDQQPNSTSLNNKTKQTPFNQDKKKNIIYKSIKRIRTNQIKIKAFKLINEQMDTFSFQEKQKK